MDIDSEDLAYWYLRLNGFLTIRNFIVHPDRGSNQETDVDLLAVRFPNRAENLSRPMTDDDIFRALTRPYFVFAEVKKNLCELNGPWTKPKRDNMNRVLHAVGAFPASENRAVADSLQNQGFFENEHYCVSIICFGDQRNPDITKKFQMVPQILWPECLGFIFDRFRAYKNEKASHGQWDETGKNLWDVAKGFRRDREGFLTYFNVT